MRSSEKGFSLVELLVVIAILSILAALVLVAVDPATRLAQARDAQRVQDINQIANAIIAYETLKGSPPNDINGCDSSIGVRLLVNCPPTSPLTDWHLSSGIKSKLVDEEGFLKKALTDPQNTTAGNLYYRYEPLSATADGPSVAVNPCPTTTPCRYWIGATLEKPKDSSKPVFRCSDIEGLAAGTGCKAVGGSILSPQ